MPRASKILVDVSISRERSQVSAMLAGLAYLSWTG
jgi:hypothetical protein